MHHSTKFLNLSAAPVTGQGGARLCTRDTNRLELVPFGEQWRWIFTRLMIILVLAIALAVAPGVSVAKTAQASDTAVPEVSQTLAVLTAAHDHRGSHPVVGDTPPVILSAVFDLPHVDTPLAQSDPGRVLTYTSSVSDIRPPVRAPPEI